jgi:hypothetical protein
MKRYQVSVGILAASVMAQLPLWAKPSLFLSRDNDLVNFFWPIFILYKRSLLAGNGIPLWNPLWFGGQPLISDPQSLLLYPGQFIFIFLPIPIAILVSFWIHSLLAGFFTYKLSKSYFSTQTSLVIAVLYMFSTRLAAAIEAGHFGIIIAWAWIPAVCLFAQRIAVKSNFKYIVLYAISISFLFQAHAITSSIIVPFSCLLAFLYSGDKLKTVRDVIFAGLLSIGLLSPVLFPQLDWQPYTTRYLLLAKPEIYPIWFSKKDFLFHLFPEIWPKVSFDTEKIIPIGISLFFVSILGYLKTTRKQKTFLSVTAAIIFLISLNNVSPISFLIQKNPILQMMRVTTRIWPIMILIILFLVGTMINTIKSKWLVIRVIILLIANAYILYLGVLSKVPNITYPKIENVYSFIAKDTNLFRVYCTDRCIRQKEAAENNIEIIDGYATLTQKNYYQKSWGLFGGYWDYYTLAIPPFGFAEAGNANPDIEALGEMNVKYIVSPKIMPQRGLVLLNTIDSYHIYTNLYFRPRIYGSDSTTNFMSNLEYEVRSNEEMHIANGNITQPIILSNTFSKGWFVNGSELQETPSNTLMFTSKPNTNYKIEYRPESFKQGMKVFYLTISFLLVVLLKKYVSKIYKKTHKRNVS